MSISPNAPESISSRGYPIFAPLGGCNAPQAARAVCKACKAGSARVGIADSLEMGGMNA